MNPTDISTDLVELLNPSLTKEENDTLDRMPKPGLPTTSSANNIGYFLHGAGARYPDIQYFKGEWLFRFKLPPFQRGIVWTDEQCIRFIESAWLGFNLGSYLVNKLERHVCLMKDTGTPDEGKRYVHRFDDFLLDGLQRMTAIYRYVHNEFPVFDLYWRDLSRRERRRFEDIHFTRSACSTEDFELMKEMYNRLNFGGTPHTEEQRA